MTGWQFDSGVPAIVHPIFHHENPYENPRFSDLFALYRREKSPGTKDAVDWIIVVLDRDNIERQALPALTNRYFREHGVLAYKVAVTASREQRVLYSSDPDFPGREPTQADAIMNIFGPPPRVPRDISGKLCSGLSPCGWRTGAVSLDPCGSP
jgi:hypothetical protein